MAADIQGISYPEPYRKKKKKKECEHISLKCHNKVVLRGVNTQKTTII
jgi:hypothetical protein